MPGSSLLSYFPVPGSRALGGAFVRARYCSGESREVAPGSLLNFPIYYSCVTCMQKELESDCGQRMCAWRKLLSLQWACVVVLGFTGQLESRLSHAAPLIAGTIELDRTGRARSVGRR